MIFHLIGEHLLLRLIPMFKELLDHIISKDIGHQLSGIWVKFSKHLVFLIAVGRLKFLLDETRAMLVSAKFHNMLINVLI